MSGCGASFGRRLGNWRASITQGLACSGRRIQNAGSEASRRSRHTARHALIGQIIVSPEENGEPELLLKGDLAGILSLAAGKKTPAHPQDERVLLAMVAGVHSHHWQQGLFQATA